jgi:hypothetical protein
MSRTVKPRPNTPPIEPPIIAGVLFDIFVGFTGASVEVSDGVAKKTLKEVVEEDVAVEEDVDTRFPIVESGVFMNCIASVGENESALTTSR